MHQQESGIFEAIATSPLSVESWGALGTALISKPAQWKGSLIKTIYSVVSPPVSPHHHFSVLQHNSSLSHPQIIVFHHHHSIFLPYKTLAIMSSQIPKKQCLPPHVKDNQENIPPNQASSVQGNTRGQVVGNSSNWTFSSPGIADDSVPSSQRSFGWVDKLADCETPERMSRHAIAHERLMQIIEESGQKTVTIPDEAPQRNNQPSATQGTVYDFAMPIRQPIQPTSTRSLPGGAFEQTSEILASDKYYWPMNSIHGMHGTPFEAVCVSQPAAIHLGHSESKYSKPMLVSDNTCGAPFVAAKKSARADEDDAATKVSLGFSPDYHGDPYLVRNQSANIPDHLNCSLFLVNLPPSLTTHRLIAAIHAMGPTGRIYATHINAPEPDRKHYGCAAKVIFFELAAAKAFYKACEERGFHVDGLAVRVMWNRIKTAQQDHAKSTTRVLLIGGKPNFVNPTTLTEYFCTKLQFQIDSIITHSDGLQGDRDAVVEYRFGSFRCQAEAAKMALVREHPEVRCFFHCDPCDPEHWAPTKPVPVVQPAPPGFPVVPPCPPPRRRPGFQTWGGFPVLEEDVKEQRGVFRPMGAALSPWQT